MHTIAPLCLPHSGIQRLSRATSSRATTQRDFARAVQLLQRSAGLLVAHTLRGRMGSVPADWSPFAWLAGVDSSELEPRRVMLQQGGVWSMFVSTGQRFWDLVNVNCEKSTLFMDEKQDSIDHASCVYIHIFCVSHVLPHAPTCCVHTSPVMQSHRLVRSIDG